MLQSREDYFYDVVVALSFRPVIGGACEYVAAAEDVAQASPKKLPP